jgi:hypothetical protein
MHGETGIERSRDVLRAAAQVIVPEAAALSEPGWRELESIVTAALADRPPGVQRQFRLLLRVIELLPVLRHGRRFSSLDVATRTRVLESLEHSRLLLLRRGVWGLRTLVFMGYYAREEAAAGIGYRASPAGWAARQPRPTP